MIELEVEDEDFFGLSTLEMPDFLWDEIDQNDFGLSATMGEQTPAKDCGEYFIDGLNSREKPSRDLEGQRESSQAKRRRQLFTPNENATSKCKEQITTSSEHSWEEAISPNYFSQSQGEDNLQMNQFVPSDDQVDIIGSSCANHKRQCSSVVKQIPILASCRIFQGRKSYMKTPMKFTASVAYPFSLIKPCGIQGEVTLKDINQFIHSPSASSSNSKMNEDPHLDYSPISGKPVVVKTKIHTEGGKGSITIMRTKG